MAILLERASGRTVVLEPEQLVGRSTGCDLRLDKPHVSAQHARLYWDEHGWHLKDLASRNGTFVDGRRVSACKLAKGARIGFGEVEQEWELSDDSAPRVMAAAADGRVAIGTEDLLAIPDPHDVRVTVYRLGEGNWILESSDGQTPIRSGHTLSIDDVAWRVTFPTRDGTTFVAQQSSLADARFLFEVSRDEEHVRLEVEHEGERLNLGGGSKVYMLLTLARARAADRASGELEESAGWVDQQSLAKGLGVTVAHLNLSIFRLRKKLIEHGIADGAALVERRSEDKQLRFGPVSAEVRRV